MGDCKPRLFVIPEVEPILPSSELCLETTAPVAPDCCENDAEERGFYNARIVLRCPAGSEGSRVVVEHGDFFSAVSQEAADAEAQEYADSQLVCLWWNTEQTFTCQSSDTIGGHTLEDDPIGIVFNSDNGFGLWLGDFSGSNTISAHTISSLVSQDEADEQAYTLAEETADCLLEKSFPLITFWPDHDFGADSLEAYRIGETVLYAGYGWKQSSSTALYDNVHAYDSLESYPVGSISSLDNAEWGTVGTLTIYP